MPSSGELQGNHISDFGEYAWLDWSVASQDIPNNRTLVNWAFGWQFVHYSCRGLRNGEAWINGNAVYYNHNSGDGVHTFSSGHDHRPRLTVASGQIWVNHNPDGTGSLSLATTLTGFSGFVSSGSMGDTLPTIPRNPNAPVSFAVTAVDQVSVSLSWAQNPADGLPNTDYTVGYGTSSGAPTTTVSSGGATSKTITGLTPGTTYYFWVKATNSVGTGPYTGPISQKTIAGARVNVGGVWKEAIPYVKVGGVWKVARPWVKQLGTWKETT